MTRVVALLACHNRRDRTVGCLESLFAQDIEGVEVSAVLVDDGSTDGTAGDVSRCFDGVEIVQGDGSLYWARAMALAEENAMAQRPEFLLWLNDDVSLHPSALKTLTAAWEAGADEKIVVGSTVDPVTGVPTYGGASRVDWHPLRFRLVTSADGRATSCDTFNGNVVLVPRVVYRAVGGIDGGFAHAFADYDYGLRARALGFEIAVAGAAVGECRRNFEAPWRDSSHSLVARYRLMWGRKGVPISSSARYLRRHGGKAWPLYIVATYAKVAVDHIRARTVANDRLAGRAGGSQSSDVGADHRDLTHEPQLPPLEQSNADL